MIIKTKKGWKVTSHTTGRSFGTYRTKKEALKRLKQIKFYGGKK
jgi:hypothetical protein